jgi:hypothetical protein
MAAIYPLSQKYVDIDRGLKLGIHTCKLVSASDTITVPQLAETTANRSSAQLRRYGDASCTVTDDADDQVTLVGTRGSTVLIVTLHHGNNSGAEA